MCIQESVILSVCVYCKLPKVCLVKRVTLSFFMIILYSNEAGQQPLHVALVRNVSHVVPLYFECGLVFFSSHNPLFFLLIRNHSVRIFGSATFCHLVKLMPGIKRTDGLRDVFLRHIYTMWHLPLSQHWRLLDS